MTSSSNASQEAEILAQLEAEQSPRNSTSSPIVTGAILVLALALPLGLGLVLRDRFQAAPAVNSSAPNSLAANSSANANKLPYIPWNYSWAGGWAEAHRTKKKMMVTFSTDWCPACKHLEGETYTDPAIIAKMQDFVAVRVNCDSEPGVAQLYNVKSYPTIIWMTYDGRELSRTTGAPNAAGMFELMQQNG